MKLTALELQLLGECLEYAIYDDYQRHEYYRLGGHGMVQMPYRYSRMGKLERLSLVERTGGYTATALGKQTYAKLTAPF